MSLYIVSTPIGNRKDITQRAIETLFSVDLIACEDTRKTGWLLASLSDKKPPQMIPFHEKNKEKQTAYVIKYLQQGKNVALVSNAGTPTIADPGFKLVRECVCLSIPVLTIPGPSAIIAALSISGLPTDKFLFLGFLPKKEGKKRKIFAAAEDLAATPLSPTFIFYESPFRLLKTLKLMKEVLGDIEISICQELTKVHETIIHGSLDEILRQIENQKIKGESTVLFSLSR